MRTPLARLALFPAAACMLLVAPALVGADRPDVADFARTPFIRAMSLSPDGNSIAFLNDFNGLSHLAVLRLEDDQISRFKIGEIDYNGAPMPKEVESFWWVGNKRLVLKTTVWDQLYGAAAVDTDGKNWRGLTWLERDATGKTADKAFELVYVYRDGSPRILMLDMRGSLGTARHFPHVLEVNTETGNSKRVMRNPGNVTQWLTDEKGVIRIGIARDPEKSWVLHRKDTSDEWRTLPLPSRGHEKLRPLGFDPHNGRFYVAGFNEQDRWSVFPFNLATGKLGDAVASDPVYDTLGGGRSPTFNGLPLARPLFSEAQGRLIGIAYVAETPRVVWLDQEFARVQAAVDRSLPGRVNQLVSQSADGSKLLFLSFSDRDPGSYHLLDRQARTFKLLGSSMDWITPARMSPTLAIRYEARDGQEIRGYLTVPVGHEPKGLPLVVLPHGGPWYRDTWGFDPWVQLFASRGYAVLQMNYRGCRGYGSAFEMLGKKQVGGAIQDDIEDATKWAIAAGVADPARIAIAGGSFGGYSALFALGQSPGLYRCGISVNGVTDWAELLDQGARDPGSIFARQHWTENIGDPEKDADALRAISPFEFAADIKAPSLIIQARDDRNVPAKQGRKMIDALSAAGSPVESLMLSKGGHGLWDARARVDAFKAMVDFLEKHLGPGVEFRPEGS